MFFKIVISIILVLLTIQSLKSMGVKAQFILLGILWVVVVFGVGCCDYMAITVGTEGWGLLGCILSMLFLFGTGFLVYYIGSEEGWWGGNPRHW